MYLTKLLIFLILLNIAFSMESYSQIVNIGKGSYLNQPPKYVPGTHNEVYPENSRPKNIYGPVMGENNVVGNKWKMINPAVTEDFRKSGKRITTNKWWSSIQFKFLGNKYSEQMFPGPLAVEAIPQGLNIGIQKNIEVWDDKTSVKNDSTNNVVNYTVSHITNGWPRVNYFGLKDMQADSTLVDDYGDWHVRAAWKQGDEIKMKATMSRGLPYVYFEDLKGNFEVKHTDGRFAMWYEDSTMLAFRSEGADKQFFVVFLPEGAKVSYTGKGDDIFFKFFFNSLEIDLNGKDYISVAMLFDQNAPVYGNEVLNKQISQYPAYSSAVDNIKLLQKHAFSFLKDTRVNWKYDEASNNVVTDFHFDMVAKEGTSTSTIMTLFPHQYNYYEGGNPTFTNLKYPSPRGWLKTIEWSSFSTVIRNPGIMPEFPKLVDKSDKFDANLYKKYVDTISLLNPDEIYSLGMDTYNDGKRFRRIAQAIEAANAVTGNDNFVNTWKSKAISRFEDWMTATNDEYNAISVAGANDTVAPGNYFLFYYNPTWQSIYGFPASFNSETEFNDHHFHWGYFIRAAVDLMILDGNELGKDENWGGMIKLLIRDIAGDYRKISEGGISDDGDPMFPKFRNWDPYMGYALASGHSAFADGNNQESSSEGQNFNSAVALFGALTGDKYYRDMGIYMFATQLTTIEEYWFDVKERNFWREERDWLKVGGQYVSPNDSAKFKYPFVGMCWDNKSDMATWFSPIPELILGINLLPYSASSVYLGRNRGWMDDAINTLTKLTKIDPWGYKPAWQNIIWQFISLANPDMAIKKFDDFRNFTNDSQLNQEDHTSPNFHNFGENGTSKLYTYYWLHTINAMGAVDTTTYTSSTPFYSVFSNLKNKQKTYTAYNPTSTNLTVTFNDGKSFEVAPYSVASSQAPIIVSKIKMNDNPVLQEVENITLEFDTVDIGSTRELLFAYHNNTDKVQTIDSVVDIINVNGFSVNYLDDIHYLPPNHTYVGVIEFTPQKNGNALDLLAFELDSGKTDPFTVLSTGYGRGGTSINEQVVDQSIPIKAYPNPTSGSINLSIESNVKTINQPLQIELLNINGTLESILYNGVVNSISDFSFDLSKFNSGVYIIRVVINGKSYIAKVALNK